MKALFPINGTAKTERAVVKGLRLLAAVPNASATFLVVISKRLRDMPADSREYLEFDDEDTLFIRDDEANAVLRRAEALAKKQKFKAYRLERAVGDVKDVILAEATRHDLLVMHKLSRNEKDEKRRGSVAEEIVRRAPCDVLLLHGA